MEEANQRQKRRLFEKLQRAIDGNLKGKHIAIWGLAFKPNTDDMREAPSLVLIDALRYAGATVTAHDPAAMEEARRLLGDVIRYADSNYQAVEGADALVVVTDWNEYRHPDFGRIKAALRNRSLSMVAIFTTTRRWGRWGLCTTRSADVCNRQAISSGAWTAYTNSPGISTTSHERLPNRINTKRAVIGVIGLGYVGLPLVRAFTAAGFRCLGFDIDQSKVDRLNAGQSYIGHLDCSELASLIREKRFEPTADIRRLSEADCIIICVPTPLNDSRDPDLSYIEGTAQSDRQDAAARAARRAGEHDLSRRRRA